MPLKRYKNEEITSKLQQVRIFMAIGDPLPVACKEAGVSRQSYYRWMKKCDASKNTSMQQNG
jgi:putative transposase